MSDKHGLDDLSVEELEQLLYLKKRAARRKRLRRLKAEGRVVEVDGLPPPDEWLTEFVSEEYDRGEGVDSEALGTAFGLDDWETEAGEEPRIRWRWVANKVLLLVEIAVVVGLVALALTVWGTTRELNREIAEVQEAQSASLALPTPTATPVIGIVVLPSGHKPPVEGRPPEPGEAGYIPDHLLPIIDSYVPPPIPTPGPEQARRVEIPAIGVDKPIVQGDEWQELKKGVGQHVGSALPGALGNLVLSAHNDIYGEIFRNLDKLGPGDEIVVSTERRSFRYVVREIQIVEPTDVWVMGPTDHSSATLISCYPYLVNNKRIVIFADLADAGPTAGLPSRNG
jgi:sortase A